MKKNKTSISQLKASQNYRERVQQDSDAKWNRNQKITLRSARNHIRNYSTLETLDELEQLISERRKELSN